MLALTDRAVELIRQALCAGAFPEGAGLRITVERETLQKTTFGAVLTSSRTTSDITLIYGADVRVFLDPAASEKLDDKLLDVVLEPNTELFSVRQQLD